MASGPLLNDGPRCGSRDSIKTIDFKKEFGKLYFPSAKEITPVDVPPMNFARVQGAGNANATPAFREVIEALYGVILSLTVLFLVLTIPKTKASVTASTREPMDPGL